MPEAGGDDERAQIPPDGCGKRRGWWRRTCLREQARQKRTFLPLEVLLPESEPSEWDDSDRELVQLCLDVVSEEDFTLFRRVTLDGWAYVDAAKAAGISLWACYKRVERTQKKLRRAIEEHPERFFETCPKTGCCLHINY
ncbi:MAG: RNA polymerase sigma factor [Flavonifractor plautii]